MAQCIVDNEIDKLILNIQLMIDNKHECISVIKKPLLLIQGLNELKKMVDMENIKQTIVEQVKFLMINKLRNKDKLVNMEEENKFDGHMLHTVISGNPGTGKTSVAKILAKIWTSMDIVKKPKRKAISNKSYIDLLEKENLENNTRLETINDILIVSNLVLFSKFSFSNKSI